MQRVGENKPNGGLAVMADRRSHKAALDLFPTPPWATRALIEEVILGECSPGQVVWEPAAGLGTMSGVLREYFNAVEESDVEDYGKGHRIGSFVGVGPDVLQRPCPVDWVVTNPPFNLALEFALRALDVARVGVALLVRSAWAEGGARYQQLFRDKPPAVIAQFCDRVPMVAGRWDPAASTATAYAWFVWCHSEGARTEYRWIKPGARQRYTRPLDVARYGSPTGE